MSNFETEWVLQLKDLITAPTKEVQKSVAAAGKALKDTNAIGTMNEKLCSKPYPIPTSTAKKA
ncbi:MAG TPA: hypothetical protein PKX92_09280 [Edaphocola sp.]|nr:hypothetical protein [Edaphocola sp.]